MTKDQLIVGGRYNWKNQPERLVYLGKHQDHPQCRGWFQFAKIEEPEKVWCEVREEDLASFEETGKVFKSWTEEDLASFEETQKTEARKSGLRSASMARLGAIIADLGAQVMASARSEKFKSWLDEDSLSGYPQAAKTVKEPQRQRQSRTSSHKQNKRKGKK
jgi:hypothetical protein